MNEDRMSQKVFGETASEYVDKKSPVRLNRMNLVPDLVHVRNKYNFRCAPARLRFAEVQYEISG
jgi:hypothetical protein